MKKRLVSAVALLAAVSLVAGGCGISNSYLRGIKASDYVDVCDYSSIPVEAEEPEISEDELDYYLEQLRQGHAAYEAVEDRTDVQDGDRVNIDFEGRIDGETFEGGTAQGYQLVIGSGSFIDGFESGLVGVNVGETVDLELTFPDPYPNNPDLAGVPVVFTTTVNSIETQVVPELSDALIQEEGIQGVETVEEYRDYVRDRLTQSLTEDLEVQIQDQIIDYIRDNSTYKKDLPEAMIDRQYQQVLDYYDQYAAQYQMNLTTFLGFVFPDIDTGETTVAEALTAQEEAAANNETTNVTAAETTDELPQAYVDELRKNAVQSAEYYVALQAIADIEKIDVSNREFKSAMATRARQMGYADVEEFKKNEDSEAFRESLLMDKVVEFLRERVVITPPSEEDEAAAENVTEEEATEEETASENASAEENGTED